MRRLTTASTSTKRANSRPARRRRRRTGSPVQPRPAARQLAVGRAAHARCSSRRRPACVGEASAQNPDTYSDVSPTSRSLRAPLARRRVDAPPACLQRQRRRLDRLGGVGRQQLNQVVLGQGSAREPSAPGSARSTSSWKNASIDCCSTLSMIHLCRSIGSLSKNSSMISIDYALLSVGSSHAGRLPACAPLSR